MPKVSKNAFFQPGSPAAQRVDPPLSQIVGNIRENQAQTIKAYNKNVAILRKVYDLSDPDTKTKLLGIAGGENILPTRMFKGPREHPIDGFGIDPKWCDIVDGVEPDLTTDDANVDSHTTTLLHQVARMLTIGSDALRDSIMETFAKELESAHASNTYS